MFQENLTVFVSDFGVNATVGGQPVRGNFDNGYATALANAFDGLGVSTTQPSLTCITDSLPANPVGQPVVIEAGGSYLVVESQPDGTGFTKLILKRSASPP